jgi:hypothetical protein
VDGGERDEEERNEGGVCFANGEIPDWAWPLPHTNIVERGYVLTHNC